MNKYTAKRAELNDEAQNEIVKVRVQSTPEEISNFHNMLDVCEQMGMCEVQNFSQIFSNKGTTRYFRAYSDVRITKEADHE